MALPAALRSHPTVDKVTFRNDQGSMSWLQRAAEGASAFEGVLGLQPELLQLYRTFYSTLWNSDLVPARLLELSRLRIAAVHACDTERAIRHSRAGVTEEQALGLEPENMPTTVLPTPGVPSAPRKARSVGREA